MAALEVNRTDRVAQPRMERPQPEPLTPSSSRPVPPTVISNEAGRLFLPHPTCPRTVISNEAGRLFLPHPTCPRTVISNEAGRLFLPHSLLRMRRPAQREIPLLFAPCTRPRPAHPHHLMKKNYHEEKNGQIRTAGRPAPRAPPAQAERRRPRQILRTRSSWNLLLPRERQSPIGVSSMNESRAPLTGRR